MNRPAINLSPRDSEKYMHKIADDKFKISLGMNNPHNINQLFDNGSFRDILQTKQGNYLLGDFKKKLGLMSTLWKKV